MPIPSIACIGLLGRHVCDLCGTSHSASVSADLQQDNPLHIALFPPHSSAPGAYLEFSYLLNSTLDIFDLRTRQKGNISVDQDLGLLQAVDERLSYWGWETGTGIRFCIVVDMFGKDGIAEGQVMGLRDGELKPV